MYRGDDVIDGYPLPVCSPCRGRGDDGEVLVRKRLRRWVLEGASVGAVPHIVDRS
jgi:hypothetical protein